MKLLVTLTLLLLATPAFADQAKNASSTANESTKSALDPKASDSSEMKVGVKGMVCAFCAQGIEKRFKAQSEVESVKVSLENKQVTLRFKEGKRLANDKISAILKEAGYDAHFEK